MDGGCGEDTIVAISTPIGEGGIGIVRLSGPKALKIADSIFVSRDGKRPSQYDTYTVHYGHIKGNDKHIDEVILTVMRSPRSYTKEDVVEINCHSGIQALKEVMEAVVSCGARIAEPGEFTKRAFLNGRIDLVQAEAVLDMITAKTECSMKAAMAQLEGEFSKKVIDLRNKIIDVASHIEAAIDFPDEQLDIVDGEGLIAKAKDVSQELKRLIDTFSEGIILREGLLAIICGKPNVGKSSLMNLLLKRDRVIVSSIPGTTRDAIEESINLKGIPVRLVDTAGIVERGDLLEAEGVKRTRNYLAKADLVLLLLDSSTGIDDEDMAIIESVKEKKRVVIINKVDIAGKMDERRIKDIFGDDRVIKISVKKRENIELLERSIVDMVWDGDFDLEETVLVTNARHKDLLGKALKNICKVHSRLKDGSPAELVAIDLKEAIFNLGLIIGKSVSDDILNRIFENFCIGK